jgi:hypothetical protein
VDYRVNQKKIGKKLNDWPDAEELSSGLVLYLRQKPLRQNCSGCIAEDVAEELDEHVSMQGHVKELRSIREEQNLPFELQY